MPYAQCCDRDSYGSIIRGQETQEWENKLTIYQAWVSTQARQPQAKMKTAKSVEKGICPYPFQVPLLGLTLPSVKSGPFI